MVLDCNQIFQDVYHGTESSITPRTASFTFTGMTVLGSAASLWVVNATGRKTGLVFGSLINCYEYQQILFRVSFSNYDKFANYQTKVCLCHY